MFYLLFPLSLNPLWTNHLHEAEWQLTQLFSVLCPAERSHAPDTMHDPGLLSVDSVEDHFLMDAGSYDEVGVTYLISDTFHHCSCCSSLSTCLKSSAVVSCLLVSQDTSAALQLQGRAMRSPRRCIPHQQSCLGYPLPCCDPCDTCYCRFFNAICYCRRVGHTCTPRRNWWLTWWLIDRNTGGNMLVLFQVLVG